MLYTGRSCGVGWVCTQRPSERERERRERERRERHGETPQPTIVGFAETRCRVCPLRRLSDVEYKQSVIISKMVVEHPKPKSPSGRDPGILCRNLGHSGNSEGDWTSSCQPLFISSPFFSVTTHEGEPMRTTLALVSASVLHAH